MICFKCESEQDASFYQEVFPCASCEEDNLIEFNICPDCGLMWRSINGVPAEDSMASVDELGEFGELAKLITKPLPDDMTEDEIAMMENINEHLEKIDKMDRGEASMADYVHRCLDCQSTAVDVHDGQYKCTDCGFEWEIMKFE